MNPVLRKWLGRWFRPERARRRGDAPAARDASGGRPAERVDPTLLRLSPTTDGGGVEIARGKELLALVRPPPGYMVLEAVAVRVAEDDERLVGAVYDLSERRGSVVRWRATHDRRDAPDMETLWVGEPESVLWRLSVRDGDLHVRDTRHGVLYRMRRGAAGAEVVGDDRMESRAG